MSRLTEIDIDAPMTPHALAREARRIVGLPPSSVASRVRDALAGMPERWRPLDLHDTPSTTVAVLGWLRAAEIAGVAAAWDGECVRADGDALGCVAALDAKPMHPETARVDAQLRGADGPVDALRLGSLALWAGQQTLAKTWAANAAPVRAGAVDPDVDFDEGSPTGYDAAGYGDALADGFAAHEHYDIVRLVRPVRELLCILGADLLAHVGGWRRGKDITLPDLAGTIILDAAEARRIALEGGRRIPFATAGHYRRLPGAWPAATS